ncbi:hypothetical protein NIES4101_64480 [Calothrix sp. NIES-4101]|nr:hypothetical protein NIES4101_64480 [Calothrix sp. NIES-4101]
MLQTENNVLTPSWFVSCDRGLGFVVLIRKNSFPEKRLVFLQANHYIFTSILPMSEIKKSAKPLPQKPKRQNSQLWKLRQFCKFWQPVVVFATAILMFLLKLILMLWREFQS